MPVYQGMWCKSVASCVSGLRTFARPVLLAALALLCGSYPACAADEPAGQEAIAQPAASDSGAEPEAKASPWYFFTGNINNQPRLHRAKKLIDQQINQPFRLIAPTFDDVKTFADQRDEFMIWTPYVGVGRKLSLRWDAFFQIGYSAGDVQTDANNTSLFLLPLHTDVTEKRSSFFTGLGLAFYPVGMPEMRKYNSVAERLKNARPFLVSTISWNYLTFEARIRAGIKPFGDFIKIDEKDHWSPFSSGLALGLDIPLSDTSAFSMNVQYNQFFEESDDFSGLGFNFYWKKSF